MTDPMPKHDERRYARWADRKRIDDQERRERQAFADLVRKHAGSLVCRRLV